ncbi:helix-turn-helix domain-containing protein [Novosphingobium marinum]|uniref:DNA-binding CsgD family transcriptional regulator n=1 Tax=Novosphingobium marinum TaxID=1514948 RepID=A0A7Y9XVJ3_9SPHN|nr:helix-turn-helix transcriptional regulator [Novosphingobium marinum]NYH95364.1 DNA-binding CsgD family transcriptional regulator [Novosphingobium marinum]
MSVDHISEGTGLDALTAKQREVLDLLIEHKTSKQISRILGISPHTVDQRVKLAKAKFGLGNRAELARTYRELVESETVLSGDFVYGSPDVAHSSAFADSAGQDDASFEQGLIVRNPIEQDSAPRPEDPNRIVPEWLGGGHGWLFRLGLIAAIAFVLVLTGAGTAAIYESVSQMLAT